MRDADLPEPDASTADPLAPLIAAARRGDSAAAGQLFASLYAELRRLAHRRLHHDGNAHGQLDTTMLVHESFERIARVERLDLEDRQHFLRYASRVMRSVIVDIAREVQTQRRGGDATHLALTTGLGDNLPDRSGRADPEVLRVHEALEELARLDPRLAQVVELRYFGGLANAEIAELTGSSLRTVERDWERARLVLFDALSAG
jgi:RNA polymerase sigma factor (TIGR02999 family)